MAAATASAVVLINCDKLGAAEHSDRSSNSDEASDEASRISLVNANTLDLPGGFTVEAAGNRSTTLRLRGWMCKRDFFDEIRASATGRLAKIDGFTTLECVSETKTITEPL